MHEQEPSRTAFAAATYRALHQVLDGGRIFADPLALTILGLDAETALATPQADASRGGLRFFIAARSAFAEAALAAGVESREVRQLVVLGAGMDTFAYRNPWPDRLRVLEVDHPATQAWKRRRLAALGIGVPASLAFAPVDFERESLSDGLQRAGLDPAVRTFFSWLGVTPYLSEAAVTETLRVVAALPGGGEIAFDYVDPPESLSAEASHLHAAVAARAAAAREPFRSHFEPDALHARLRQLGFDAIEDLSPRAIAGRYLDPAVLQALSRAGEARPDRGARLLFAAMPGQPRGPEEEI